MLLHMTDLQTFARCETRADFSYFRGWHPPERTGVMFSGKLIHEGLKAGYRALRADLDSAKDVTYDGTAFDFVGVAYEAINLAYIEALAKSEGDQPIDRAPFDEAKEVVDYYWRHQGVQDQIDRIVAVEEPVTVGLGGHEITCNFDFVCETAGEPWIWDHKTVGDSVKGIAPTLPLDLQINTYLWAFWKVHCRLAKLQYNVIRRAVPHELTKSGRKSTASKDPADYLARKWIWKSAPELEVVERELWALVNRMLRANHTSHFGRTPIRTGGEACALCPYLDVCVKEYGTGERVDEGTARLLYTVERREGSDPSHDDHGRDVPHLQPDLTGTGGAGEGVRNAE